MAAASGPMNAPIQLVENKNNQLSVNPQAMEILNNISQPLVVVAVVGRDCTRKSYLMNCLAGQNQGFSLGSTIQSETKGIWMWCVPHPTEPNHTLVLLDTEGLGDVEKGDPKNDAWILALAVLLSSTFVYNSMSSIKNDALEKLHFVTELIQLIRAKSSPRPDGIEDASEFVSSFQDFVWTAWNFTLEVKVDGYSITEDEYLENVLKLIPGKNPQIQASNQPRECNSQFLPRRKCFVYNWPVCDPELLATIENNPENQLNPKFQKQLKSFCSHIFTFSSTKKLREGIMITGNRLGTLVETYVGAVNSGAVLCLDDAVTTLARRQNSMAVRKAADHYSEQMAQRVRLPTDTLQELLNLHTACEKEAIALFMEHSFGDEKREFKNILVVTIEKRKEDFLLQNETASLTRCQAEMQKLSEPLKESVSRGDFSVPGGHSLYLEAKRKVEQDYERVPRKGVKANEVPQDFPKSEAIIEDTILQSDRALTDRPKAMAGDKAKKEGTQKEQKMLRKKEKEQDKVLQAQKRSFRENIAQTQEKMEGERKDLLKEQERTLEHKMNVTMASGVNMKSPICLVENDNAELRVNPSAVRVLSKIAQPVVVVAIVGLSRTGKSYLMNRLAGQNHGFNLGTTVRCETKGIWMWCVPHPTKPKFTLVLLDTEGLGNVEKGDPKNDSWIFTLAVLLSSTFVYNSMGTINHQALEQLHYVTELTELIRAKSTSTSEEMDDSDEFVSFFPDFVWTVRDFILELKLDGRPITEDQYLENALKLIPGRSIKVQNSNMPRECIRHFFPKRKCFVFDRPTKEKELLVHIEEIPEDQLDCNFQTQSKKFCSYIFSNAKAKTLKEGITVTGTRLGTLVTTYVDAINSGAVPCLENAVIALAQHENSMAVQKAADHYSEQMAQRVRLPTDTLQELLVVHTACEKEAIALFMEHSFKDENREFQKTLVVTIEKTKEDFMEKNEAASVTRCQAELEKLSEPLMESLSRGAFSVPGGHSLYLEAKKKVEQGYERVPRKGVKANQVLQNFLQSQATVENSILQADKALADGQKAIEAERAQKEAAKKEQELLRQKQKELEQVMEAQNRSYKENVAQMQRKMELERENILREQEKMLEHKLKVQEDLLNEGFKRKYEAMDAEISQLQKQIEISKEETRSKGAQFFDEMGNVFLTVLPGPGKLLGLGMKIMSKVME